MSSKPEGFILLLINQPFTNTWRTLSYCQEIYAAAIGVTESRVDKSITDSKTSIDDYDVLRCGRNRYGGGVSP